MRDYTNLENSIRIQGEPVTRMPGLMRGINDYAVSKAGAVKSTLLGFGLGSALLASGCATNNIMEEYRTIPTVAECATMIYQEFQDLEVDKFKDSLTGEFQLSEVEANKVIADLGNLEDIADAERFITSYRVVCNMADGAAISFTIMGATGMLGTGSASSSTAAGGGAPPLI